MKILLIGLMVVGLLVGCAKDNTNKDVAEKKPKQEVAKKDSFDPAAFMEESKKHGMEWYFASVSKLTPEQAEELEKYNTEQENKQGEALKNILDNATKKEVISQGEKNIEYTMVNTLGHDVKWFQLYYSNKADTSEGGWGSETADNVKNGQEFKLHVPLTVGLPAGENPNINMNSVILEGGEDLNEGES
jgi:hypothetical protein